MPEWKDTVNLPRTDFPMKANLQTAEPEAIARWDAMDLYGQIRALRRGAPKFVFHDGPPYANGQIHLGTALNKILKDIVIKSRTMAGFDVPYTPGYDCHGLPIELKVDRELGPKKREMSVADIRRACREYAGRYIGVMTAEFKRLMVFGNALCLLRAEPDAAYEWFMEMFIDAYDWVMVTNVYAMSQFAAGPAITTKPYISGSNYLRKMSDLGRGDWEADWDALYWTFVRDHLDVFAGNPRSQMIATLYDRLDPAKKAAHTKRAHGWLAG